MSKPFTIHEDDHSEKANMMRKAIEKAFNECWYCEKNDSVSSKFGQLICEKCSRVEILAKKDSDDKENASLLMTIVNSIDTYLSKI